MADHVASRIVVGVDESAPAQEAAAFAAHLARALDGHVTLVAAYVNPTSESRSRAEGLLERLAATHPHDVALSTLALPAASHVHALHEHLVREDATMLVVGRSHTKALARAFGGSTAERMLHHAPCPVVVVPSDWSRTFEAAPRTIGVATNGSPESRAAVDTAVDLAQAWPARLRLLSVFNADEYPIGMPFAPTVAMVRDRLEHDARAAIEAVADELPEAVLAQGTLLLGAAAPELASHSAGLALLVIGSRGYGPLRSVVLGGVGGSLIRTAACPVMVVPRRPPHPSP